MDHKIYLDSNTKTVRDDYFDELKTQESEKKRFNPFIFSGLIFFLILIAFVVMMAIVILILFKQGFSGVKGVF